MVVAEGVAGSVPAEPACHGVVRRTKQEEGGRTVYVHPVREVGARARTHRGWPSGHAFLQRKNDSGRWPIARTHAGASLNKLETFLRPKKCDSQRDVCDGEEEQTEE